MNDTELAMEHLLCQLADKDQAFNIIFQKENKSIKECCDYVASEVKKMKRGFIDGDSVIKLAREYYANDKVKFKSVSFTSSVASNDPVFVNQMNQRQEVDNKRRAELEEAEKLAKFKAKCPEQMNIFDIIG